MKYILLFLLSSLTTSLAVADSRSFDRTWIGLFGKTEIAPKVFIWNELQLRMDNDRFTNQQLLLRPGLLYKFSDKLEGGILYAYVETGRIQENRPTLQLVQLLKDSSESKWSLRHRMEFRLREDVDADSLRYRALLRFQKNLSEDLSVILWDEPFLNATNEDWTGNRIFERNRAFIGMGFKFLKVSAEIGYMNQFTPRTERDIHEHILTTYFFY